MPERATGLLISIEGVAFAMPPLTAEHYRYVPQPLRAFAGALVVTTEQAAFLSGITPVASPAETLRRAIVWREKAEVWLTQQTRALAANRQ